MFYALFSAIIGTILLTLGLIDLPKRLRDEKYLRNRLEDSQTSAQQWKDKYFEESQKLAQAMYKADVAQNGEYYVLATLTDSDGHSLKATHYKLYRRSPGRDHGLGLFPTPTAAANAVKALKKGKINVHD